MKYDLNKEEINYKVTGKKTSGDETVLLHQAIDLTFGKNWSAKGFTTEKLFEEKLFQQFKQNTKNLLSALWKEANLLIPDTFELDQYHIYANDLHLAAVDK